MFSVARFVATTVPSALVATSASLMLCMIASMRARRFASSSAAPRRSSVIRISEFAMSLNASPSVPTSSGSSTVARASRSPPRMRRAAFVSARIGRVTLPDSNHANAAAIAEAASVIRNSALLIARWDDASSPAGRESASTPATWASFSVVSGV